MDVEELLLLSLNIQEPLLLPLKLKINRMQLSRKLRGLRQVALPLEIYGRSHGRSTGSKILQPLNIKEPLSIYIYISISLSISLCFFLSLSIYLSIYLSILTYPSFFLSFSLCLSPSSSFSLALTRTQSLTIYIFSLSLPLYLYLSYLLLVLLMFLLLQILLPPSNVADTFAYVPFDGAFVAAAIDDGVVASDFPLPLKL